ncbi:MAG: WYL domain-containing protein [Ruminococcaceae bacterium]|nr:WYL domain-containing protein [Oscillospiraceae bacterium]
MRDFYVYGFKSREEYDRKSARSYDDERRRMESWLGEHMRFVRTTDGKNVFISIDSRSGGRNPLYKAWKAKSFTDGDITLHFILFDILYAPSVALTLSQIMEQIDTYLCKFSCPKVFDESTIRKKLKEYEKEGLVICEKQGKRVLYHVADSVSLEEVSDALDFFSEVLPCGVIGSFMIERGNAAKDSLFSFKHHYINAALDSEVLATLFLAMRQKSVVHLKNQRRGTQSPIQISIVPLRVFISAQSGRQHVLAYLPAGGKILSYRIDYLSEPKIADSFPLFDEMRAKLDKMQPYMWGVNCGGENGKPERVEFTIYVGQGEEYIVRRLYREKRNGSIEKLDDHHYRFSAMVYDTNELTPWIRTFLCRITRLNFDNRTIENQFKRDIQEMYHMYGIDAGEENA